MDGRMKLHVKTQGGSGIKLDVTGIRGGKVKGLKRLSDTEVAIPNGAQRYIRPVIVIEPDFARIEQNGEGW